MNVKRLLSFLTLVGVTALAVGVYAAIDRAAPAESARAVQSEGQQAAVTPAIRAVVRNMQGRPLAANADTRIRHLFTPADRHLPSFFAAPTKDGGACVVTSATVLSACLMGGSSLAGTITIADDSEGDALPPFVYGLVRPDVRSVSVSIGSGSYEAALTNGFYVFELPSPAARVDDVGTVVFTLSSGQEVRRGVGD